MKDYLIWIGEEMEKIFGGDCFYWMDRVMNGMRVPDYLSVERYLEAMNHGDI